MCNVFSQVSRYVLKADGHKLINNKQGNMTTISGLMEETCFD